MGLKGKLLVVFGAILLGAVLALWGLKFWSAIADHRFGMLVGGASVTLVGAWLLWKFTTRFTQPFTESQAAFESIFQAASIGIVISDREGIIRKINPFTNHLFGYQGEELLGQKIEVLVPRELRDKHVVHRSDFNQNPRSRAMGAGMDLSAVRKDGTLIPVEISLTFFEDQGRREIVSFISDITERKKNEVRMRQLNLELEKKVQDRTRELSQAFLELQQINRSLEEEMEQRIRAEQTAQTALEREKEINEMKSRFVSMASHEFRTPLSGILTSASLISRYDGPEESDKRRKHVQVIKGSVHTLTTLLNDFLSLDKLEKGRIEHHPSEFYPKEFAEELVEEMKTLARPGQRILYSHEGDERPVFLDKQLLRSILINLLSNAVKYSPEGKEIHFNTELRDARLRITIRDQGIGIPEADQKNLFDTFFRATNVTAIQGTGLGLNIVKRCLDLMGGVIEFSSRENEGSTFKVVVPETRGDAQ